MNRIHKSRHPIPGDTVSRLSKRIAEENMVGLAWVLRDAVSKDLEAHHSAS